jgi:large subunit ribosomal protein L19
MNLVQPVEQALLKERNFPDFKSGDTITVHYKIIEGNKERVQQFRGSNTEKRKRAECYLYRAQNLRQCWSERIFPMQSPFIQKIEVNKTGQVRRARIYYFRGLTGKKARIEEKRNVSEGGE